MEALADAEGPVGVTELARQVDMDKSSVSRMLRTLETAGYVSQDPVSKSYLLGLTLVHLGQKVLRRLNLRNAARGSLEALAMKSGECAHIAVLVGGRALYIDQATPARGVSIDAPVGTLAPLHCTALGKCLLAFQPALAIEALLPSLNLEAFTRRTLTDIGSITRDLEQVRERQVSFDDEEFSVGVRCIATPVFKHDGTVAAAIGLSGPSPRVTDERLREWETMLREEAMSVSMQLGWEPPASMQRAKVDETSLNN
ncbi:IclR family transcriptional regulator [Paraburkholderia sp. DHOC27]|nr:IclR family transcriptional regulator [Paraburkholderia sp. DHOC27]